MAALNFTDALQAKPKVLATVAAPGAVLSVELEPDDGHLAYQTPWRALQIADSAGGLVEANLILNLNETNALGDVSWVGHYERQNQLNGPVIRKWHDGQWISRQHLRVVKAAAHKIYRDGAHAHYRGNPKAFVREVREVTANQPMMLHLATGGGVAMRFINK